jgi:hypothetical protein
MQKAQIIDVRGKRFYVCQYTGALINQRYFVPSGRVNRGKEGCFATLPILLRALYEMEGEQITKRFADTKKLLESYFQQPDIPMQPALPVEKLPLSSAQLADYLVQLDQGQAWLRVPKAQSVELRQRAKRARHDEEEEEKEEESDADDPPYTQRDPPRSSKRLSPPPLQFDPMDMLFEPM